MGELKLELQSANAQFGSKSAILLSRVTLKFDGSPSKTIGHLFYAILSFVHHIMYLRSIQTGVTVRKPQIWVKIGNCLSRTTLKFDR